MTNVTANSAILRKGCFEMGQHELSSTGRSRLTFDREMAQAAKDSSLTSMADLTASLMRLDVGSAMDAASANLCSSRLRVNFRPLDSATEGSPTVASAVRPLPVRTRETPKSFGLLSGEERHILRTCNRSWCSPQR